MENSTPTLAEPTSRALAFAERRGFKLAVYGRTVAASLMAGAALWGYYYPNNLWIAGLFLLFAAIGLLPLAAVDTRYEIAARFAFFAMDALLISAVISFAPLSSGDDVPQNLVFLTSRVHFYYIVIVASVLTLSPRLVIWTGAWSVAGLVASIAWIIFNMGDFLSYEDLPLAPNRDAFYSVVLSPSFLGMASRLQEVLIIGAVTGIAALAVHRARHVVQARAVAETGRRRMQRIFGKYVPPHVVQELASNEGYLRPQMRDATLLFADVEEFTAIAEKLPPEVLISVLNELFSATAAVVAGNGGLVVSYMGDAFVASFNAPLPVDDHAERAVAAARDILRLTDESEFGGHRLRLRIGVASGPVAAGTVGSDDRLSYTLYGDTVNLAQRLESLNKEYGTSCLLSGETAIAAGSDCGLKYLGSTNVRNRQRQVDLYVLTD
ncbi:adenylate/guanylate cyclase domain-containing protein [Ensifer adhaerens]|uniref:adenylate/guanylate cyclase domain-containing protein n=1 Tax=Ensifer adhaerens TaxID=106592 RepID=UPI001F460852|nr:adenylate/guanylate cyclase domain-containing protein [Ensifer adhaerens]